MVLVNRPAGAELIDVLSARLTDRPIVDSVALESWRLNLTVAWALRAGLRDDELGGPYEPPSAADGTSGRIYVRWGDGAVSHGDLDHDVVDDWPRRVEEWRTNAYRDPDAPEVAGPATLPAIETAQLEVAALVEGAPDPLLELLGRARRELTEAGLAQLQADVSASFGWRWVLSSAGLRAVIPETAVALSVSAEELHAASFGKRRLPHEEEIDSLLSEMVELTPPLRLSVTAPDGELPVLLAPGLAMSLIGTYLVGNLTGATLVNGRGAFTLDDLRASRQVARDDLHVVVDSTLRLEGAASPLSGEGVPGGRATLVEHGRLLRPLVDLKYAGRTGFPPTPVPGGAPGFLLRSTSPWRTLDQARASLAPGLELHSVLGLHTQDAASGQYSLVAPRAMVCEGGRHLGRAKVIIGGSFFAHLLDQRTQLVSFPGHLNPGLLVWTTVRGLA